MFRLAQFFCLLTTYMRIRMETMFFLGLMTWQTAILMCQFYNHVPVIPERHTEGETHWRNRGSGESECPREKLRFEICVVYLLYLVLSE